jgi:tetratricopeptide (TPR) repeat protein
MKTKILLSIGAAAMLLASCSDFLDKTPLVNLAAETYYSNEEELNAAALGAYSVMQLETFQLGHFMVWGDDCSDDADLGNSRSEAYSWFGAAAIACQNFSLLDNNGQAGGYWNQGWSLVNDATQLIVNATKNDIPNKEKYIGEGHFLRAYSYFNFVTQYGRMPVVDHVLSYDEYYMPRNTEAETWAHIENDLKKAVELLPEQWDPTNLGRATKGAAMSMLGKAYIYQKKWQEAYDILKQVEAANYYRLEPVYEQVFDLDHQNGQECIFAIQQSISGTGWSDSNEGSILVFYEHDAGLTKADIDSGKYPGEKVYEKYMTGWSMHCPTDDLIAEFENNDPRLKATVIAPGEFYDGHIHYNLSSNNRYQSKKYYVPFEKRSKDDQSDQPKNIIILRYADVLLFLAEASNELGKTGEAQKYLEMVRARARNSAPVGVENVLPPVTAAGKEDLRNAIWHERRVELAMEYNRMYDLVRQGRAGQVMQAYYQKYKDVNHNGYKTTKGRDFVIGKSELCPIPKRALDASRGTMEQNPGY